ncbi:MAG: hypothetical protein JW820_01640 [Spirochaetales bacterium]|nr:hypothetical protein [Spirochaetales bacterium]
MRRTPLAAVALLLMLSAVSASAQTHLAVDVRDPVYRLIELGELKGALSRLSAVRPYSRSTVVRLLEAMWAERSRFSAREQQVLEETLERFAVPKTGWRHGNVSYGSASRTVQVGGDSRVEARVNVQEGQDWHLESLTKGYFRGDLAPWLSYMGTAGATFDRVRSEAASVPYSFTKEWDAFHVGFGTPRFSYTGETDWPTFSYHLGTDVAASFYDGDITLRLARLRRDWSVGDNSFTLSSTARPFLGVQADVRFAHWLSLSHVTGALSDWYNEPSAGATPDPLTDVSYQKLFTLQRLEIFPAPWLYISASSSVIGAKRLEPGYMAPLIFSLIYQNLIARDLDNVGVGLDLAVTIPRYGRAYFSFFGDEMEITNLSELFTRPRNMFALQAGLEVPIPGLPFTGLTLQYTKIEPFVYAHFPSWYPDYNIPVDTAYTHDGENLGYPIPPNSDEFLVRLWALPLSNLSLGLTYRLIRHGDNPSLGPGDLAILGRTDGWMDYDQLDDYPDKDFLHDGLYDWNNIVTLSTEYTLPSFPVTFGLSYSFSHTFWVDNSVSDTGKPDEIKNILALSVSIFR